MKKTIAVLLSIIMSMVVPMEYALGAENSEQLINEEVGLEQQDVDNQEDISENLEEDVNDSNDIVSEEPTEPLETENSIEDNNPEETQEQEDLEPKEIEHVETTDRMTGGYTPSELDSNTPIHKNRARMSTKLPVKYPTDMNEYYAKYPDNRNQNPYGTCWAFSSLGLAEFDLINDGIFTASNDLSELQLAYFTYNFVQDPLGGTEGDRAKYYNENTTTSYLNYGGNYEMAARRLTQWSGAVNEADVPYGNAATVLTSGLADEYAYDHDTAHLEDAYLINIKKNATDVKKNIMEHGAAGVMYYHDDYSMCWNDTCLLYTYYDTAVTGGGHAVMIVGWDDDFSKDQFVGTNKPTNNGAWLVRNSWGLYCNYFWMSYETVSLSDTAWIFDFNNKDNYNNNYQYDGGLLTYPTSYTTLSNVFKTQEKEGIEAEKLEAVSVSMTRAADVNYTIDIYTNLSNEKDPTSGIKQDQATTSGVTTYAGIYTIPLKQTVELDPGTTFSVVISVDQTAIDYEQAMSIADFDTNTTIWDCAVSYGNEKSFYKTGGKFYPYYWGNYCIKAFTSNINKAEAVTYNISYELNGGTNAPENPVYYTEGNETLTLYDPIKEGFVFDGWYLESDFQTEITNIPENSTKDYVLYAKWIKVEQKNPKDELALEHKDDVLDGIYTITSDIDRSYALDVKGGLGEDGASIQLFEINGTGAQLWKISHDEKGYLLIESVGTGKYLTVNGMDGKNGSRTEQNSKQETQNQKWIGIKASNGGILLYSGLEENTCLDVNNAGMYNENTIQLYAINGTRAQIWHLDQNTERDILALKHKADVPDGIYNITSGIDRSYALDVKNGSVEDGTSIQIYEVNGTGAQLWKISHDEKGYLIIKSVGTGKALATKDEEGKSGTGIQQSIVSNNKSQKWIGIKNADGGIMFYPGMDGNTCLDVMSAGIYNGNAVQLYEVNGTLAQVWYLDQNSGKDRLALKHKDDIQDGIYSITSAINRGYALDVKGGSIVENTPIQIYETNGTGAQQWKINHDEKGYLIITCVGTGKVLTVEETDGNSGSRVRQMTLQKSQSQKWVGVKGANGSIQFYPGMEGQTCLDIVNAGIYNGNAVQLYEANGTLAQAWYLESVSALKEDNNAPVMLKSIIKDLIK